MMEREYKDSGIPWMKHIPTDWNVVRGKDFLFLRNRPVREDDDVVTCFRDGEVVLRCERRTEGFTMSDKEIGYQGINKGDIVIHGMDGFAGAMGVSKSTGKGSPVLIVCNPKSDDDARYIIYYLRSLAMNNVFVALATGIRERSCDLRWNKISVLPFVRPSSIEQTRIADYIDEKCVEIDSLIALQEQMIEKLKAYKQSVITEAVTKGLNPNAKLVPSGIDWIGDIPEEWKVLKTLFTLKMPITDGPHTTPKLFDNGIPFVSAEAVSCGNGSIDFDHIRGFISQEFYEECCLKYIPEIDDVYMIKSGATTGKVSIVDTDKVFTIWSPLAVFRSNRNIIIPRFMFYTLQGDYYQKQISLYWTFGTQQNIGMRTLEQLVIVLPPISEQHSIASYLDEKCSDIDRLIALKQQKIESLKDYKKSVIYEAVTGKTNIE